MYFTDIFKDLDSGEIFFFSCHGNQIFCFIEMIQNNKEPIVVRACEEE